MGEGINLRRGGKPKKLPILNPNLPANASVEYMGGATFDVEIVTPGYPEEYTYQWYKNGSAISGATETSYSVSSQTASAEFYCIVTSKAGSVQSRTATFTVGTALPTYTYSGDSQLVNDSDGNWRLKLTSTGTLRFTNRGTAVNGIDVFVVGGGRGGGGGGGGGGFAKTYKNIPISVNTDYSVVVGGGGASRGTDVSSAPGNGGQSSFSTRTAAGGNGGGYGNNSTTGHAGGNGGSGGGSMYAAGGTNGSAGTAYSGKTAGTGQGGNTGEFGVSSATRYAGGGGGGSNSSVTAGGAGGAGGGGTGGNSANSTNGTKGTDGLGGGGGGSWSGVSSGKGGSGIVIIRNKR